MIKNLIFCFSGTGNSLKVAKDIAAVLGDTEIVLMKKEFELNDSYERIGFVYPCYAGGTPKAVMKYVELLNITPKSAGYFFAIVTCGREGANSLPMLSAALTEKGAPLNYGKDLPMVGNYIAMYDLRHNIEERLKEADEKTSVYAKEILNKKAVEIPKARMDYGVFYKAGNKFFLSNAKKMNVSDACTHCNLCERLCPTHSINLVDKKPMFTPKTCAQCMACIQWCPSNAVNCGNTTQERTRYRNPNINVNELI